MSVATTKRSLPSRVWSGGRSKVPAEGSGDVVVDGQWRFSLASMIATGTINSTKKNSVETRTGEAVNVKRALAEIDTDERSQSSMQDDLDEDFRHRSIF